MNSTHPFRRVTCGTLAFVLMAALGAAANSRAEEPSAAAQPAADSWAAKELPLRKIPNVPQAAESYYAPDSLHIIAQSEDPAAQSGGPGTGGGALVYTFTDLGTDIRRINDRGQDACSYYFPDMKHLVWTSTRDHMDMRPGDWVNDSDYPQGAELYVSDLDGKHIRRLTNNKMYEAEVTVSPDGKWIFFGRQTNGKLDIWRMRSDGTHEQQLTFAPDWQPGAPYPMADNEHVIFRAWKKSDKLRLEKLRQETGQRGQTPMTIFTMRYDGTDVQPRTFTNDMNWAPYPTPDGRHFLYVRINDHNNWDVVMSDLAGGEPQRLTYNPGFDGFPSISPDGKKMLLGRAEPPQTMADMRLYVMDVSSLHVGPENYKGSIPAKATPPAGWKVDPDIAAFEQRAPAK